MAQAAVALAPELVRQDPWLALLAFRRLVTSVPGSEAIMARDHGWGLDVWTFMHGSTVETRQSLADQQWALMAMYPELDVDFHIVDRQDTPLESFVLPTEYDLFIRVRSS
jgi:hypothetical protein